MAHVSFLSKGINMNFSFICEQNAWSRLVHRVNKSLPSFKNTSLLKWEANKKKYQYSPINSNLTPEQTSTKPRGLLLGFTWGLRWVCFLKTASIRCLLWVHSGFAFGGPFYALIAESLPLFYLTILPSVLPDLCILQTDM